MKVRSDFVSNSSSSSFILGNDDIFDHFHITKQDILDALIDAYGKENYEKAVEWYRKSAEKHPQYYSENIKYNQFGPFWVYDLADPKDREIAIEMWGDTLKGWDATNCYLGSDGIVSMGNSATHNYNSVIDGLCEVYGLYSSDIQGFFEEGTEPKRFVRSNEKDPETGNYGHYEPLPPYVLELLRHIRKDCGYMDNLDALKCECARFFVHADDNELWVSDSSDDDESWESETYTYNRICEIVYRYLVKTGRINPDDREFIDSKRIDEKYLSRWDVENGCLWDFSNGKNLTWADLCDTTMTQCMHEG